MWARNASPFYYYEPDDGDASVLFTNIDVVTGYQRRDAITDKTLARYRRVYGNEITKENIFTTSTACCTRLTTGSGIRPT